MMSPAKSMREAVKKRGGENSSVHFPIEKMLDQAAYIKITTKMLKISSIQ